LKALCEDRVRDTFRERALIVRPGLIVGPHDTTDRFPYWPRRLARGGEVLAPGSPDAPTQFIDARDLAAWMVTLLERGVAGTYNATGPARPLTLGEALARIAAAVGGQARLTWVSEEFLQARRIEPWMQMPLWLHAADQALDTASIARALVAGLTFRPLEETARDTLAWEQALPRDTRPPSPVLSAEREAEVLAAWSAA
jgi:2'-hydroxyisoflavone reductase